MDLGTAVIGLICLALCAMPFVLTNRSKKNREFRLLASIKELAKQHDSEITKHEIGNNYTIAVDEMKNYLYFQFNSNEKLSPTCIQLSSFKACKICRINNSNDYIERLDLELIPSKTDQSEIVLNFFNKEVSYQPNGELDSIREWSDIINSRIIAVK